MSNTTKYIIHTADLHIGSGNRSVEYRAVFDSFLNRVNNFPTLDQLVVVIAGDIFHHKNRYSGQDVLDFQYLIDNIKAPVIIIPGNHDTNLNNAQSDLLSPLCDSKNIHYWKDSGDYELNGQKYYHCSVFDNSTAQDIAKLTLTGKIFLYHGMVNGCQFGKFTEHNTRITTTTLNSAKLALLGDIHQHQYVTPTAAYSGSLIQQNLGESAEKGFIIWNLETLKPIFIPIPNNSGFVRIDLRGMTNPAAISEHIKSIPKPDNLLKVSLITDAQGDEYTEQLSAVQQSFAHIDLINRVSASSSVTLAEDITETLAEILLANNATEEQLDEIVNLHAQKIQTQVNAKWTVTKLQWSNLFKYGPDNAIDFTKLQTGGVIAENMAGKSSIIDILVFGLFGEHLRADRLSMINANANRAHVRVYFETNNAKYYIDRTDDRSKNNKIILCKSTVCDHSEPHWENITDISIDATYRKIKAVIGSLEHFLSTGLYYDASKDIIKMNKVERMRLLPELFGLTDNESILKDIKAKIKLIKEKIGGLVKPRGVCGDSVGGSVDNGNLDTHIAENTRKFTELSHVTDELTSTLHTTSDEISKYTALLQHQRCATIVQEDITKTQIKLNTATNELNAIKDLPTDSTPIAPCYATIREINDLNAYLLKNTLTETAGSLSTQIAIAINSLPAESYNITTLNKQLSALKQQQREIDSNCNYNTVQSVQIVDQSPQPLKTESQLEEQISNLRLSLKPVTKPSSMIADNLKTASKFTFNPNCADCGNTKVHLANDLHLAELALKEQTAEYECQTAINSRLNDEIATLSIELSTIRTATAIELKCIQAQHADLLMQNKKHSLDEQIRVVETNIEKAIAGNATSTRICELKQQLARAQKIESSIAIVEHHKNHNNYQRWCQTNLLSEQINKLQEQLIAFKAELQQIDPVDHEYLATQKANLVNIQKHLSENNRHLGILSARSHTLQTELNIKNAYDTAYPPLQAELDKFNLYATCIGSAGLRMAVIKKNMSRCIESVNNILSLISTFKIRCDITELPGKPTQMDLYIDYATHSTPIALGSGFQQFIISIAFRLVLTQQLSSSAEFIIIDEGFGALDPHHRAKLNDFFSMINSSLKFTFIISHIDDIQSIIQQPIYIANRDGRSYINNTVNQNEKRLDALNGNGVANSVQFVKYTINDIEQQSELKTSNLLAPLTNMVSCECGASITRKSYPGHLKTAKHLSALNIKK